MNWSLYRCGRTGHITYAPDEAHLREQMHAATPSGDLWQCLRCGAYVPGRPDASGPAAQAPIVRREGEIRGDLILKLFAVERGFRVLLFGAVAFGIWKFANSRLSISAAIKKELPIVRSLFSQLGFTLSHSLLDRVHSLLHVSTSNLHLIALGIAGLAVVSGIEAFALWQAHRWGEYFAMIVTSLGLPLEVYELSKAVTATKAALFVLNLLLVVYLVSSRRLFGVRGGKEAYEARLRAESVIDAAAKAAAAAGPAPGPGIAPSAGTAPGPGTAAPAWESAQSPAQAPAWRSAAAATRAAQVPAWTGEEEPSPLSPWPAAAPPPTASAWPADDPRAQASPWPSADRPAQPSQRPAGPWPTADRPAPGNPWSGSDEQLGSPHAAAGQAGPGRPASAPGSQEPQPATPPVPPPGPRPAAATVRYTRPGAAEAQRQPASQEQEPPEDA